MVEERRISREDILHRLVGDEKGRGIDSSFRYRGDLTLRTTEAAAGYSLLQYAKNKDVMEIVIARLKQEERWIGAPDHAEFNKIMIAGMTNRLLDKGLLVLGEAAVTWE